MVHSHKDFIFVTNTVAQFFQIGQQEGKERIVKKNKINGYLLISPFFFSVRVLFNDRP